MWESKCKECKSLYDKEYKRKNAKRISNKNATYYIENKKEFSEKAKVRYFKNAVRIKENAISYYYNNQEKAIKRNRIYYYENRDKINNKHTVYMRKKRKDDNMFRVRSVISNSIYKQLKGKKDNLSVLKYLPYTIKELTDHLESQFESWMNWNNWGMYKIDEWDDKNKSTWTWQIDHIIPHSKFNYTSMEDEDFIKCWALSNLRPLKSIDNLRKGSKLI